MQHRFLEEYANYKKQQAKLHSTSPEKLLATMAEVDRIVRSARRGLILLDEAMRLLSNIAG